MIKQTKKGKDDERKWARKLQKTFPKYKDNIQRISGTEKARAVVKGDVACLNQKCILNRFMLENKARKRLNVQKALEKATDDGDGKPAILRWNKPYEDNIYVMKEREFLKILRELQGFLEEKKVD